MKKAFHTEVKEGWSLFIGGLFTPKFFMGKWFTPNFLLGDGVVFRGDGILHQLEHCLPKVCCSRAGKLETVFSPVEAYNFSALLTQFMHKLPRVTPYFLNQ